MNKVIALIAALVLAGVGWLVFDSRQASPAPTAAASGTSEGPAGVANGSGTAAGRPAPIAPSPAALAVAALAENTELLARQLAAPTARLPPGGQADALGKVIDATAAYAAHLARERSWDPATVVSRVGKDRTSLFHWVREQTALVPYPGSLRDAVGVMMDRVGNSLDRSLLLADLLSRAGIEVRLARAPLDADAARHLAATWAKRARPAMPAMPVDDAAVAQLIASFGGDSAAVRAQAEKDAAASAEAAGKARAQIANQTGALLRLVAGTAPETDPALFADHWWVQARDGEAWIDLDPSQAAPGRALAAAVETFARDAIPEDLRHTLTVRVIGEIWRGDAREEPVLVEHTFAPSSFYGQRIAISTVPIDLPTPEALAREKDQTAAARAALASQTEWAPVISVGGTPVVRFSVTDAGELFDLLDAHGNATRLARGVQKATREGVGAATGILAGLPDGSDSRPIVQPPLAKHSGFTAQWIEYEIRAPQTPPRLVRRTVFDAFGAPADRTAIRPKQLGEAARLDRGLALVGETEVLPMFARIPEAFVADRIGKGLSAMRATVVESFRAGATATPPTEAERQKLDTLRPLPGPVFALGLGRFAWTAADQVYLDQLDVLTARRRYVAVGTQLRTRHLFDIIANDIGVWPGDGRDPRAVRAAQGVADTLAESALSPCAKGRKGCIRSPNTSDAFAAAPGWSVVTDAAAPAIAALPVAARSLATADLAAGYALVVPPAGTYATWWRVRPETGETLGQAALGGSAQTEAAIMNLTVTAISGTFCFLSARGGHLMGCVIGAMLGTVGGIFSGITGTYRFLGFALTLIGAITSGASGLPDPPADEE